MLSLLAGSVTNLRSGQHRWATKKIDQACERVLSSLSQIPDIPPIVAVSPLRGVDSCSFVSVCECPLCLSSAGIRSVGKYFHTWTNACAVQAANLLYEIGLILWAVMCRLPDWASGRTLDALNSLRNALRQAGHDSGMFECPQCGRFTTCLYGHPTPVRAGFCKWCLDMGGGLSVSLSLDFDADGKLSVRCIKTDYTAPARNAWDILPGSEFFSVKMLR